MDKYNLITRNLAEVIGTEDLKSLSLEDRPLKIYWGTAPTGKPHLGYFVPLLKIADFLEAGCEVIILLADLHAILDGKTTWNSAESRCQYYEILIKAMCTQIGVDISKLSFVRGTSFQLKPEYTMDVYRLCTINTVDQARRAGSEVVKADLDGNQNLSQIVYPLLQCLDEEHLDVDVQFGGVDQRKIFMSARDNLPRLGYRKRVHLMNHLVPGLGKSGKMSSSEPNSKIDFDDSDETIKNKLLNAFSVDGLENVIMPPKNKKEKEKVLPNCLLALLNHLVFPFLSREGRKFLLIREEKYGGNVEYESFDKLRQDFIDKKIASFDLKMSLIPEIIKIVTPVRNLLQTQHLELSEKAYD